jgi:hypothetical protein
MVLNAPPLLEKVQATPTDVRRWLAPDLGRTKLNTDGSFVSSSGKAGGGMVLRNAQGEIIFSACREIRTCDNALAAELAACREGLELALYRTEAPITVELDCAEAVAMITTRVQDRSIHRSVIEEIRRLAETDGREILLVFVVGHKIKLVMSSPRWAKHPLHRCLAALGVRLYCKFVFG